jgi:hypothetical protein
MLLELEGAEDGGDDMFLAVEEDDENGARRLNPLNI